LHSPQWPCVGLQWTYDVMISCFSCDMYLRESSSTSNSLSVYQFRRLQRRIDKWNVPDVITDAEIIHKPIHGLI
jgi:hypothetical protein